MQKPPTLALAPMQDVTNLPFMRVMQQYGGPDYYVTEYFRVHADYTLEKKILSSITENETGRPVFAQLIGQDIEALVRVAQQLQAYPVAGIDLNLGCPAPVVCRKDAGGGLLRKRGHMEHIIAALRDAVAGKFTVKTRVGYSTHEEFPESACVISLEFKKIFMDEWTGVPDPLWMEAIGEALRRCVPGLLEEI